MTFSAGSGELTLSPDASQQCVSACDRYLDGLDRMNRDARIVMRAESFGTLPSGQALGTKFFNLAHGANQSFEQVIQQHIDVIQRLREVFVQAGAGYRATDENNAALLNSSHN